MAVMFQYLVATVVFLDHFATALTGINCTHPTAFYDQLIDHSSSHSGTFKQQYQVILDYYKPGGPILFFQGAETANMSCTESTVLEHWAPTLGAAIVQLEHRFFGVSNPSTDSNVATRYKTLTLDNVLQDSVALVEYVKKQNTHLSNARVIAHGGSYGGFLSAMLRLNHPKTFYGSIAWAGPTESFGPDASNPKRANWYIWLSNLYQTYSAEASAKIKAAFAIFHEYLQSGTDYQKLAHDLNLCEVPHNLTDLAVIYELLLTAFVANAQFSFGLASNLPGQQVTPNTFSKAISATRAASSSMEVLNASLSILFNGNCADWTGQNQFSLSGSEQVPFNYLECVYFPANSNLIVNGTIFPAGPADQERETVCAKVYNLKIPTYTELSTKYHFTQKELYDATRLLFTFGTFDPVSGWAPWELYTKVSPDRNTSRMIVISEGGHTEDSINPAFLNKPGVLLAQKQQLEYIKGWLGVTDS